MVGSSARLRARLLSVKVLESDSYRDMSTVIAGEVQRRALTPRRAANVAYATVKGNWFSQPHQSAADCNRAG